MSPRGKGYLTRMPVMFGAVIVSGGLAGFGVLSQEGGKAPIPSPQVECHYCGVVEQIREVTILPPHYRVSTIAVGRDEGIVMLLSALSGATVTNNRTKIYEVSVRMDNGSVRAVRGASVPEWTLGERVKIVKNRVKPLS